MPSRDWQLRLQDILESIREIERRTRGMTFEECQELNHYQSGSL